MPNQALRDVEKCIKDAKGDPDKIAACEQTFKDAGGTVGAEDGGKVFSIGAEKPEIITTGGKVFQHKA